jgi:hypothetical protein
MKTRFIFPRISVIILILVGIVPLLFSQEKVGKEIHEMFSVNNESKLQIENKYGNVDIQNWDKKNIEVTVRIKLFDVSEKDAQELLSMININKSTDGNTIIFKTEFADNFNKGLNHYNDGDKKFEVNYIVNMPGYIPLNLSNKYGNVFIDKLTSISVIDVKYGKLKANNIASEQKDPLTEINLGYAEGNIESCSWLKINIKYSKIEIADSKALIFASKYSKIFVDRGSSLVTESKYDTYEVGAIANFVTNAEYSNFKFNSIGKKLYVETSYSDVKVGYMPASFELIKIINRYGSYNIAVEDGASYTIAGIAKYGDIVYPDNSKVNRSQETTELSVDGTVGSNINTKSKVEIDTKYGTVKLIK